MSPEQVTAMINQALALHKAGKLREAEPLYREALKYDPRNVAVLQNIAIILKDLNRHDEAIEFVRRSLQGDPKIPHFYRNAGSIYRAANRPHDAVPMARRAAELAPNDGLNWNDLGVALDLAGHLAEALAVYERAIRLLEPVAVPVPPGPNGLPPAGTPIMELARSRYNLGTALGRLHFLDEAMREYDCSLKIVPNFPEPHRNRAAILFNRGELLEAFAELEWRWKCGDYPGKFPDFPQPVWDGSDLNGRTILLWWEQGLGDTMMFCRYVPLIKARGGRVALMVQKEVKRLVKSLPGVDELWHNGEAKIKFDVHASLMSVPHIMRTTRETIPASRSYLHADPADIQTWSARLAADGPGPRVGLVWAGGAMHAADNLRSIRFSMFDPILRIPGIRFYTLQLGDAAQQLRASPHAGRVVDHTAHLKDFADTAAMMANLDLLISVDTSTVHLAGSIGKEVWTMLHLDPDFRWLADSDNPSRWYPTLRHFRQTVPGEWKPVIERVAQALRERFPSNLRSQ